MSTDQVLSSAVGGIALLYGVRTLWTRKVPLSSDDRETDFWLYGWRAVLLALLISALCFASAFGPLQLSQEWRG